MLTLAMGCSARFSFVAIHEKTYKMDGTRLEHAVNYQIKPLRTYTLKLLVRLLFVRFVGVIAPPGRHLARLRPVSYPFRVF